MRTEVGTNIEKAKHLLDNALIVAIPTETVYGLAANGRNCEAIAKIYTAKKRPLSNPLILHYKDAQSAFDDVLNVPENAKILATKFWPGPLTMLLEKKAIVPDEVTAGKPRVAIRVPAHETCHGLLKLLSYPIAAPSANLYGRISPTSADHVKEQLNNRISYILDGGNCSKGIESTIIGFEKDKILVYRLGSTTLEEITKATRTSVEMVKGSSQLEKTPETSGMVKHHYAPNTPMFSLDDLNKLDDLSNCGFIGFDSINSNFNTAHQFILSNNGDLDTAASELYRSFHVMDARKFERLYIEWLPEKGIGRAINDRIKRAIQKTKT
jgi:L-threonylcarbamoyladenylate synthase